MEEDKLHSAEIQTLAHQEGRRHRKASIVRVLSMKEDICVCEQIQGFVSQPDNCNLACNKSVPLIINALKY